MESLKTVNTFHFAVVDWFYLPFLKMKGMLQGWYMGHKKTFYWTLFYRQFSWIPHLLTWSPLHISNWHVGEMESLVALNTSTYFSDSTIWFQFSIRFGVLSTWDIIKNINLIANIPERIECDDWIIQEQLSYYVNETSGNRVQITDAGLLYLSILVAVLVS